MAIFRGIGGAGDSTTDATVTAVTEQATAAAASATAAASSATSASTSASNASTSATNAANSATSAASSASNSASSATNSASSATSAASSATAAAASETAAAASETAAAASETAAAASESAAATSETNAASSASSASTSATAAATSATAAASSASAASTSATNAATSETNAGTSETNAASSATAAAASATSAASSASSASTSASNASTSATNAATSETNAATSETNAASSATSAASSATSASTSASNASTSETNAATSASNASTSATNAATSATNAASSATSAASAQTAAESARDSALAAYDNFDDRYLGAKSSDPSLDNDGNALVAGALYFNTTDEIMKVYTGSTWVDAYAAGTTFLAKASNLSDLANAATARTNLGVAIGTDVQAYSSVLAATTASFTTAKDSKLSGIESGATADQTAGEIKTAYESNANTNAFTDAEQTKLSGIETGADVTDATNVAAAGAAMDSDFASQGLMKRGATSGSYSIVTDNSTNWNTAYGWGDHASAGYLTSETYTGTVTSVAMTTPTGLTVTGSPVTSSGTLALALQTGYSIPTTTKQTQWDTAYGWGNHASAGYLTSETSHADVVVDGDFASQGLMKRGATAGSYTIITDNSANWNTAYGWGDHASAGYVTASSTNTFTNKSGNISQWTNDSGYLTTETYTGTVTSVGATVPTGLSVSGSPITSSGTLAITFAAGYSIPTTTKQGQWDTAYGWGNHASAGYLTGITGQSIKNLSDVYSSMAPSDGQVLTYDTTNGWQAEDASGGIALTDLSVGTEGTASGDGAIAYNNTTGVFTYTPPTPAGIGAATSAQGTTADSAVQPGDNISTLTNDSGYVTPSSTATFTNKSGNISQWTNDSGYLTSETSHADVVVDGDFASQGLMKRGATAGSYSIVTDNSTNWNTAYGWGDHSSAGYLTGITGQSIKNLSDVYSTMAPTDGQLLTWDNANSRWDAQDAPVSLPSQTGNAGYLLTTNGTTASWTNTINGGTY